MVTRVENHGVVGKQAARIKEEPWDLTSADVVAIPAEHRRNGIPNAWTPIWMFQVPIGHFILLRPEHHLSVHLRDITGAEVSDGACQVKLTKQDPTLQEEAPVRSPALYVDLKEFKDKKKMATLDLVQERVLEERFFLVLSAKNPVEISEKDSYFRLETVRFRQTI